MDGGGRVAVAIQQVGQRSELVERYVGGSPTHLTHEVVVMALPGQMDDAGTLAEMHVMDGAGFLEGIDGPIDGRQVDGSTEDLLGEDLDVGDRQMSPLGVGQHPADGAPGRGDPHPLAPKSFDQILAGFHNRRAYPATVLAVPN